MWVGPAGLVAALMLMPPVGRAQQAREAAAGSLGSVYHDAVFGFALRPPADSQIIPFDQASGSAHVERVRFVIEPKRWALRLGVRGAPGNADPATVLDALVVERRTKLGRLRLDARHNDPIAGRRSAAVTLYLRTGGTDWAEHVVVVEMPPNRFLVLRFESPAASANEAARTLKATLATLQFPGSELTRNILSRAEQNGRALYDRCARRLATLDLVPETYLRVIRRGRNVGLIRLTERRDSDGTAHGITVEAHAFTFRDDGSARESRETIYTDDQLVTERWDYGAWFARRDADNRIMRRSIETERGLRERDMLVLSFSEAPGQRLLKNQTHEVPKQYFARALLGLLPRLVDLQHPGIYALPCYDRELRGIVTRIIRTGGKEVVDIEGRRVTAYRVSNRETVLGPDTHRFVDQAGRLLKAVRGEDTLLPVSKATAEQLLQRNLRWTEQAATTRPSPERVEPGQ